MDLEEKWRDIIGYEGYYQVSNLGRVKSLSKTFKVHRLVAKAFIPNPEVKRDVNHIDGDRKNNILSNLEWCTRSENMLHSSEVLKKGIGKIKGAKLIPKEVLIIKDLLKERKITQKQIAARYSVDQAVISNINTGKTYRYV